MPTKVRTDVDADGIANEALPADDVLPDAAEGPAAWREKRRPVWGLRVSDLQPPPAWAEDVIRSAQADTPSA